MESHSDAKEETGDDHSSVVSADTAPAIFTTPTSPDQYQGHPKKSKVTPAVKSFCIQGDLWLGKVTPTKPKVTPTPTDINVTPEF